MPRLRGIVAKRQAPLLKQYGEDPESAMVTDRAVTIAADLSDRAVVPDATAAMSTGGSDAAG